MNETKDIFDGLKYIEFDSNRNKQYGIKSAIVWGNYGQSIKPLVYVSKPRFMTEHDFERLLKRMDVNIYLNDIRI